MTQHYHYLLDQELHTLPAAALEGFDVGAFEAAALARIGMPQGMAMRHRPAHFSHLFSGEGYAAAYYCYLWAEVLDADAFGAFKEAEGGVFDKEVAGRVLAWVYGAGNTVEPGEAFRRFRGRDPAIAAMLKKKGLVTATE